MAVWPRDVAKSRDKLKSISTTTVPIATKLDTLVTYLKKLFPINSHGSWVKWSFNFTWQIKTKSVEIICEWLENYGDCEHYTLKVSHKMMYKNNPTNVYSISIFRQKLNGCMFTSFRIQDGPIQSISKIWRI